MRDRMHNRRSRSAPTCAITINHSKCKIWVYLLRVLDGAIGGWSILQLFLAHITGISISSVSYFHELSR